VLPAKTLPPAASQQSSRQTALHGWSNAASIFSKMEILPHAVDARAGRRRRRCATALLMGATYDPSCSQSSEASDCGRSGVARAWYQRAKDFGSAEAPGSSSGLAQVK